MADADNRKLQSLWAKAGERFNDEQKRAVEEYERTHNHCWNIHKHKKIENLQVKVTSLDDFQAQITKRQAEFGEKRAKYRGVFDAMSSLGPAVNAIGGQAAAAGGLAFPPAPMVFSAVMFLFNAGKDVSNNYDALEKLFVFCNNSISDINQLVSGRENVPMVLQNASIQSLIAVLDVLRMAAERTQKYRITDYFMAMAKPGEGGPEIEALGKLKYLAKRLATKVEIDTNVNTGLLVTSVGYVASDVVLIKNLMLERKGDKSLVGSKTAKSTQQKLEDKARKDLNIFLDPETTMFNRIKEFVNTTAPETCQWIFEETKFKNWLSDPGIPFLWIYGHSGVGKSHLATSIVKYFGPSRLLDDKGVTKGKVAAYFCWYNDTNVGGDSVAERDKLDQSFDGCEDTDGESHSVDVESRIFRVGEDIHKDMFQSEPSAVGDILQTLCWQLSEDDKEYERYLIDHLDLVRQHASLENELLDIWNCLFPAKFFGNLQDRFVTFVIDGLDNLESKERGRLYDLLRKIAQATKTRGSSKIKFVLLSQPGLKDELEGLFPDFKIPHILVTEKKTYCDIEKFIDWSVKGSTKLSRALKNDITRTTTIKKLALATNGVFEMGALLMKQLLQKDHVDVFSEILKNPPDDIQSLLAEVITQFAEKHTKQDAKDLGILLIWVSGARRLLTLAELNAVMGIESDKGEFLAIRDKVEREFSAYFSIVETSQKVLPQTIQLAQVESDQSFAQISSQNNNGGPSGDGRSKGIQEDILQADLDGASLKFSHASIAKFFREVFWGSLERTDNHLTIARTCLQVLRSTNGSDLKTPVTSDKLIYYAANHFQDHLAESKDLAKHEKNFDIAKMILQMFRDEAVMDRWVRECQLWRIWFDPENVTHLDGNGTLITMQEWLSQDAMLERLTTDEKAFLTEDGPRSLTERYLKPLAFWFAKKWLQDPAFQLNDQAVYEGRGQKFGEYRAFSVPYPVN